MKQFSVLVLLCALVFISCKKNNCYTCVLYVKANGLIRSQVRQPTYCRIKKSEIDQMVEDSSRKWTQPDGNGGTLNYEQSLDCKTENYW